MHFRFFDKITWLTSRHLHSYIASSYMAGRYLNPTCSCLAIDQAEHQGPWASCFNYLGNVLVSGPNFQECQTQVLSLADHHAIIWPQYIFDTFTKRVYKNKAILLISVHAKIQNIYTQPEYPWIKSGYRITFSLSELADSIPRHITAIRSVYPMVWATLASGDEGPHFRVSRRFLRSAEDISPW